MQPEFLSESELERARRIADCRNSKNNQVPNYRETRQHSDWLIHYAGVRAEMAVCKRYNFPIDEHFSFSGDDGHPDLYIGDHRIEVKGALYDPPILKLNNLTDFKSDVIILCYCPKPGDREEGAIRLAGVVSRVRFQQKYYKHDFGYGERVCMNAKDMATIDAFDEWLKSDGV